MNSQELVFIDLSSIAYPIWHMSQANPDANHTSQQVVARVRALANGHAHVAVCCDSGRSFRRELVPSYKANRPEHDASLQHQINLACEQLRGDGFPVWSVSGYEADDLIATAVTKTLATEGLSALVITGDKDLLQLVGPRVRAMSVRDGSVIDEEGVFAKFGVPPSKMRDYLTLVGDQADNVKGARGIGPKKAAELLHRFDSIDGVYVALQAGQTQNGFQPSIAGALREFQPSLAATRALVTLRTDVDLPFDEIAHERVPAAVASFDTYGEEPDEMDTPDTPVAQASESPEPSATAPSGPNGGASGHPPPNEALAVRDAEVLPAPAQWERQLDPRSMREARTLAKDMYDSHMFSAYGSPPAVLSTIMVGRELGLPAMASLRSIHNIEGRHALAASLMVALVLRSGLAEYFEPIEFTDKLATFETKRKGARNPVRLTHTIEMAQQAWTKSADAWAKSGWGRVPTDMLVARATARLARMVYPDLLAGLYTPDELNEIRESVAA